MHVAVVSYGHSGHTVLFGCLEHVFYAYGAVEKGVFAVDVKMDEFLRHRSRSLALKHEMDKAD